MKNISRIGLLVIVLAAFSVAFWQYRGTGRGSAQLGSESLEHLSREKNVIPIAVIGSGPAGLNAALYGARAGIYTVVFQGKTPGGQLTGTTYVENWPSIPKMLGSKLMEENQKQAEKFGALMAADTIKEVDFSAWPYTLTTDEGQVIKALTVILATGSNPRLLSQEKPVPGEAEYWGYGVTSCAVCDAPFYKGKQVVVVGGGDSAIEEATMLTSYASEVTILVRGAQMRAAASMQARLKEYPTIKVLYQTKILEVLGDGSVVTGVRLENSETKKTFYLKIDGVFLAIGHLPNTELVKKWITLDSNGYVILPERTQKTNVPGVFAAGDVADHRYRQAGVAAGDGIKAALDALEFLQERGFTPQLSLKLEKNYYDPHQEGDLVSLAKLVTSADFDTLAKKNEWIVAEVGSVDCVSCKMLLPVVRSVATKLIGKAAFAEINLSDDPQELVQRFALKAVPTLLVFHKGKLRARYPQQLFSVRELYTVLNTLMADTH